MALTFKGKLIIGLLFAHQYLKLQTVKNIQGAILKDFDPSPKSSNGSQRVKLIRFMLLYN
jgi:hypothetical protein